MWELLWYESINLTGSNVIWITNKKYEKTFKKIKMILFNIKTVILNWQEFYGLIHQILNLLRYLLLYQKNKNDSF